MKAKIIYSAAILLIVGTAFLYAHYTNARDQEKVCAQIELLYLRTIDGAQAEASMDWHLHQEDYAMMGISREEAMLVP